jgi:hypothetical protein
MAVMGKVREAIDDATAAWLARQHIAGLPVPAAQEVCG